MKKKVIGIIVLIVILLGITALMLIANINYKKENVQNFQSGNVMSEESQKENKEEEKFTVDFSEEITVENIIFKQIELTRLENKDTEFRANVKNASEDFFESKVVEITAFDEEKEVLANFSGIVTNLAGMEENIFYTKVLLDITDAKFFEISFVNNLDM